MTLCYHHYFNSRTQANQTPDAQQQEKEAESETEEAAAALTGQQAVI